MKRSELLTLGAAAVALSVAGLARASAEADFACARLAEAERRAEDDFSEIWVKVVAKAWDDERFKKELLENPAKAIREHFNYEVPPQVQLEIVEQRPRQPAKFKLTLPDKAMFIEDPGSFWPPC